MSTHTSKKRRNEYNERVNNEDDEYIENQDDHVYLGSGNETNVNDDNGKSCLEAEQYTWEIRIQEKDRAIQELHDQCQTLQTDLEQCHNQWKDAEAGRKKDVEELQSRLEQSQHDAAHWKNQELQSRLELQTRLAQKKGKKKSKNDLMINYANIFTELILKKESSNTILEFMERHPIVVQQINSKGDYPVHVACRHLIQYEDDVIMLKLMQNPIAVRHMNRDGDYPLHVACRHLSQYDNDVILLKLIDLYKMAVKKENDDGCYPLHIACECIQSENVIMKLIEIFPDAAKQALFDSPRVYALHYACENIKSDTVIRKLIEINRGALHIKNKDKYPHNIAINCNQSIEIIQYMLNDAIIKENATYAELFEIKSKFDIHDVINKYPIIVQQVDSIGDYLLHAACRYPEYKNSLHGYNVIMKLIELYAIAVTKPNNDGFYPLHIACQHDQSDIVIEKLIEIFPEAVSNSLNKSSISPLNLACKYSTNSDNVIRTLIRLNPVALQQKDKDGNYPIHLAIRGKQSNEIIQHILNVDPLAIQQKDYRGESPLHMDCLDTIYILLMENMVRHSDASINMRDHNGRTPLHHACIRGKDCMVKLLLQYPGIDVNFKTGTSHSNIAPLHFAVYNARANVERMLLDHPCIIFDEKEDGCFKNDSTPLEIVKRKIQYPDKMFFGETQKVSEFIEIKKLLEEFPVKRRWKAFIYLLGNKIKVV